MANLLTHFSPPPPVALDLGSGTGFLGREYPAPALGLDLSVEMLSEGQLYAPTLIPLHADFHQLPLQSNCVPLAITSFGINHSDPRRLFREIHRVLIPGGGIAIQEWATLDFPSQVILEAFESESDVEQWDTPPEWSTRIQDADDLSGELRRVGFEIIEVHEHQPLTLRVTREQFFGYRTIWEMYQVILSDPQKAARIQGEIATGLPDWIEWSPRLWWAFARKPVV